MKTPRASFPHLDVPALEEQIARRDRRRLAACFIAALALHGSTTLGLTFWTPPEPVAPPGEMSITVDLAPAFASSASQGDVGEQTAAAPQEQDNPAKPDETPDPIEDVEEPTPEPVEQPFEPEPEPPAETEPLPEPPQQEPVMDTHSAENPEVALPAAPMPAPRPKPKVETPRPAPTATAREITSAQAAAQPASDPADVGGSGARANPSDVALYIGRVRAALEKRKRYPSEAGGASGIVSIRFTVDRSGQLTGFAIVESSGNAALDQAARTMAQNASLPPIPDGLPDSLTVGVPVSFRIR